MDESSGAQYALQLALQTMKERCQVLQKRVVALEEENILLKQQCLKKDESKTGSLTEVDRLKSKISDLTEEKSQLRSNILMVASENKQLWSRLSKLAQDNKELGNKLTRISDSINQHTKGHNPLIRSKTFTQEAPYTRHLQRALQENDKISLELEDVSLKLLCSITKEKQELEIQCNEMSEIQCNEVLTNSFGFAYLDDELVDDSLTDDLEQHLNNLKFIKNVLEAQNELLSKNLSNLEVSKAETCQKCEQMKKDNVSRTTIIPVNQEIQVDDEIQVELEDLSQWATAELKPSPPTTQNITTNLCPMCCKQFVDLNFDDFAAHVERHFIENQC